MTEKDLSILKGANNEENQETKEKGVEIVRPAENMSLAVNGYFYYNENGNMVEVCGCHDMCGCDN
jgi:hypothetical protein